MKKKSRFLTGLLSAVMALSLCALPAAAVGEPGSEVTVNKTTSVIDEKKSGSITIYKYLHSEEISSADGTGEVQTPPANTKPLQGAGFTIYQVMSKRDLIAYYNGDGKTNAPKVDDYFKKNGDGSVVGYEAKDLAEGIAEKVKDTGKTNADGKVQFTGLELGLYLVIETYKPDAVVEAVKPFLVSVPMTRVKTSGNKSGELTEWLYDVIVYPKNSTQIAGITLVKYGATGADKDGAKKANNVLEGVQFRLDHYNDTSDKTDKWETITTTGTNKEGKITASDLKPGKYRFVELGYASGKENSYIINKDAVYEFTIDKKGEIQYTTKPSESDNWDFVIDTANKTIEVYNYKPDMDKNVQDRGTNDWVQASDYNVGDEVPYQITVTVPKNIADLRTFKVTDAPNHLAYVANSMTVTAGDKTLEEDTHYTLDTTAPENGFTVAFVPSEIANYAGQQIVISYKSKLLENAAIDVNGNHNTAKLIYSNKTGKTSDPSDDTTNEIEDSAIVYTFKIKVVKTDEKKKALAGVEFDLYREVAKTAANVLTDDKAKALGLEVSPDKAWVKVNTSKLVTDTNGEIIKTSGELKNEGLAQGRYALVETKTAEHYNLLKGPIYVELKVVYTKTVTVADVVVNGKTTKHTVEVIKKNGFKDDKDATITGTTEINVINRKGFDLPTTGGFGTLLFSAIGALLVVGGVGVLMSTKKKKGNG